CKLCARNPISKCAQRKMRKGGKSYSLFYEGRTNAQHSLSPLFLCAICIFCARSAHREKRGKEGKSYYLKNTGRDLMAQGHSRCRPTDDTAQLFWPSAIIL